MRKAQDPEISGAHLKRLGGENGPREFACSSD